jgi:tetratricopeptide (TPR) repeat protein
MFLRKSAARAMEMGRRGVGRTLLTAAEAELRKATDLGDRTPALFEELGATYEQLGQLPKAVAAYTRAAALDPKAAQPLVMRGWVRVGLKEYDRAQDDFTEAVKRDPEHAEAHTGLGYVQACRNVPAEAQQEALQALMLREITHRANDYLIFHNAACIYAELARSDVARSARYEDQTIALLRRAIDLWKRRGSGPDELALIKSEPAFARSLRARPEFQALLDRGK